MLQLIQPLASLFIGIAMTAYGLLHAITRFPGSEAFAVLAANLPAVGSVLLFLLGLLAVIAGICLVVLGVRNLRRRWSRFGQIVRYSQRRQEYDDDGWEPA